MEIDGVEWNKIKWSGMEWNEMKQNKDATSLFGFSMMEWNKVATPLFGNYSGKEWNDKNL